MSPTLCFGCVKTSRFTSSYLTTFKYKICQGWHNILLHLEPNNPTQVSVNVTINNQNVQSKLAENI